jgi:hypothetical protein
MPQLALPPLHEHHSVSPVSRAPKYRRLPPLFSEETATPLAPCHIRAITSFSPERDRVVPMASAKRKPLAPVWETAYTHTLRKSSCRAELEPVCEESHAVGEWLLSVKHHRLRWAPSELNLPISTLTARRRNHETNRDKLPTPA